MATYPFKAGLADSLGNAPPAIVPVPYTGFTSNKIVKNQHSLGSSSLSKPEGVLVVEGEENTGEIPSEGDLNFYCDPWTPELQNTTTAVTLTFTNNVNADFTASFDRLSCAYEASSPPTFASPLSE